MVLDTIFDTIDHDLRHDLVILSFKIPKVSFGIYVEIEKAYPLLRSDLWIGYVIRLLYNLDIMLFKTPKRSN